MSKDQNNPTMIKMFGIELSLELVTSMIKKGTNVVVHHEDDEGKTYTTYNLKPLSIMSVRGKTYLRTKDDNGDLLIEFKRIIAIYPYKDTDANTEL